MLKVDQEWIDRVEAQYPGFREMVERWDAMELPPCPSVRLSRYRQGLRRSGRP